jgi:hypothetical protein
MSPILSRFCKDETAATSLSWHGIREVLQRPGAAYGAWSILDALLTPTERGNAIHFQGTARVLSQTWNLREQKRLAELRINVTTPSKHRPHSASIQLPNIPECSDRTLGHAGKLLVPR